MAALTQQFNNFWQRQSAVQRIVLIVLILVVAIFVPLIVSWATAPSYSVAFSGITESDAGEIIQVLDESNIAYKLQGGGTILVPSNQVYQVRMMLARDGLPESGTVGFELFSGNTFGMTEFTQKVNYQRAIEGELERTIGSLDAVEAAQVHIVTPEKSLLVDAQEEATAAVTIQVRAGKTMDMGQVRSIAHLVASSVEGLDPESVVIVDTDGNLLASGGGAGSSNGIAEVDTHRAAEVAAAQTIERKVQTMLDSVLGPNKSVVQASVIMDWSQRETVSQMFDPTPAAIRSSQKVNETYKSTGSTTGGVPGAGTNLPTPVANTATGTGSSDYTRTEETINYEITQVEERAVVAPGTIERITLSVMVDGVTDQGQLASIQTAVAAAAGIDTTRGDVLAVESMAFDRSFFEEQAAELEETSQTELYIRIGTAVAAGLIVLMLLWYISRLFRNLRLASSENWTPVMRPVGETALPGMGQAAPAVMPPPFSMDQLPGQNAGQASATQEQAAPVVERPRIEFPRASQPSPEDEQMQRVMSRMTEENPATVADIIQIWLNEDERRHG